MRGSGVRQRLDLLEWVTAFPVAGSPGSRHYRAPMSTSVVLAVTPKQPLDPDRWFGDVPVDVAAALMAAGQPVKAGLWRPRVGQCRLLFQLRGRDRIEQGQRLEDELRELGYDADVSIGR